MPNQKISELTSGTPTTIDTGVMVQGGVNKKFTFGDLPTPTSVTTALNNKVDKTTTVNGQALSSNVTLTKTDVGLGNVDNTSDSTKNAATATLTNKTISGADNTITNIAQSSVTNLTTDLAGKQATLVSGTNIKTVNGNSLLGSGDVTISAAANIAVKDEGTTLTSTVSSFNFVGSGVTATNTGNDVTVTIAGGGGGGGQILFDAIVAPSGGDYTLLSSAISAGKKTIFVRKGTYTETATITLNTDGITIIGESKKDTIIRFAAGIDGIAQYANNCYVTNITLDGETNNSSAVYIIGDGKTPGSQDLNIGVNNVIDNCILKGPNNTFCIYIAGPTYTPGSATLTGFEANGLHRGNIVRNCELHSSWDGDAFSFSLQKNGAFDNNVCYGGRIAFYMCRNSSCSFNKVVSSANQGIFFAGPSYDNVLNGNTIFDATSSGIKLENQLEHTPLLAGQGIIGNTISNNTVNNSGVNGIEISGTSANPIKDNTFVGNTVNGANDHTIYLQYSERNIIKGNILKNPKMNGGVGRGSGIYLVANVKNNVIEGNAIDGTNYHTGISNREDNSCTGNIIKGNKITGTNTERTIWFQSNETQIEGNSIEGGSYAGIRLLDASFCNISDNKLKNNTRDANNAYPEIWIQGSSVDNIIDNNVIISDGANKAAHGISLDGAGVVSTTVGLNEYVGVLGASVSNTGTSSSIIGALALLDTVDTAQIATHAVTNTQLAQMNSNTVKGRLSGNGTPQDIAMADLPISTATQSALNGKQETLVSGTNIKTVNGTSLLGSGNIVISGGGSTQIRKMFAIGGTIGATGTNVANTVVVDGTYTLQQTNLWYSTAGNGTLTIDVNKNGTTVYATTKPGITGTNQSSINSGTITTAGCVSGDVYTIDIDAVPGTPGTDLFVELVFTS